jgi:hypothetical protein
MPAPVSVVPDALPRPPRIPDEALRRNGLGRPAWIAISVSALSVAAALVVMLRANGAQRDDVLTPPEEVAGALVTPPIEPTSTATAIDVELRSLPTGAAISVDGSPAVGPTLRLPRDGRNRVIRVTAQGKAPWQAVHHSSSSASYDVFMVDSEPPPARPPTTATRSSTASRSKAHKRPPSALRRLDF